MVKTSNDIFKKMTVTGIFFLCYFKASNFNFLIIKGDI